MRGAPGKGQAVRAERLVALAGAALLAACQTVPPTPDPGPPPPAPAAEAGTQALALLAWFETARTLGPEARSRLGEGLRAGLGDGRCGADRVRLAALELALDAGRTRRTLAPCLAGSDADPGVRMVAQVLAELAAARVEADRTRERLGRAEARIHELERQLEALKAIERSIRERGRASGAAGEGPDDGTRTHPARR